MWQKRNDEMWTDFGKNSTVISHFMMDNQAAELVQQYKHLGTMTDNTSCFEPEADAVCETAPQCMQFYHKLCRFNVNTTVMKMCYSCFIQSVPTFLFLVDTGQFLLN